MIFNEYMNSSYKLSDGRAVGGRTKLDALLSGPSIKDAQFQNLPLVRLLKKVRKLVAIRYQDESDDKTDPVDIDHSRSLDKVVDLNALTEKKESPKFLRSIRRHIFQRPITAMNIRQSD